MTAMPGNMVANRLDEAPPEAPPSKIARNKKEPHEPDTVIRVVSNHVDHGSNIAAWSENAIDELIFVGLPGASSVIRF